MEVTDNFYDKFRKAVEKDGSLERRLVDNVTSPIRTS